MSDLEKLKTVKAMQRRYHLSDDFRYCIALMLSEGFPEERNYVAVIIARELCLTRKTKEQARIILEDWNQLNDPPIQPRRLERALRNGYSYSKDYRYQCKNRYLESYCIGESLCPNMRYDVSSDASVYDEVFYSKLPDRLSNTEFKAYISIIHIERRQGHFPGQAIRTNYREFMEISALSPSSVKPALTGLEEKGLIKLIIGSQYKWEGKATVIARVIQ